MVSSAALYPALFMVFVLCFQCFILVPQMHLLSSTLLCLKQSSTGPRFEPRLETIAGYLTRVPEEDRVGGREKVLRFLNASLEWKSCRFNASGYVPCRAVCPRSFRSGSGKRSSRSMGCLWFQGFGSQAKATSSEQLSLATPADLLKVILVTLMHPASVRKMGVGMQ